MAVFGGGVAGLTAAHELAERGFAVTVYERRAWGGKARSTQVPDSATGGRRPLPGEHSWRLFAGFYQNIPDTMRRIRFGDNARGVFDNLVADEHLVFAREGDRQDFDLTLQSVDADGLSPAAVATFFGGLLAGSGIPPEAVEHFAARLVVFLSSCDARRHGQWEHTTWTDFIGSDSYGVDYHRIIGKTFTEVVQASKAERTSALFSGHILEAMVYSMLGQGSNGPLVRSLNRPTNEAWIRPWLQTLRGHGVKLRLGREITGFQMRRGHISGARIRHGHERSTVHADWYVLAVPVERARRLWSPAILAADPHLGKMWNLETGWMNGMKFFLSEERPLTRGHMFYVDAPWLVTSISQSQFWPVDFANTYGDGRVRESLSAIISDWNAPGVLYGKPARECTPQEVIDEVWEQMKRHVNKPGRTPLLTDDLIVSWNIDPGMTLRGGRLISHDPLVLPTVGQGPDRPDVNTAIPNLILTGDYLLSQLEVANMEAASFNGRRAANAVIEHSGTEVAQCAAIETVRPPEWEPFKRMDEDRYQRGLPNVFDV
ncbi:MAG: hypothetical protein QOF76_5533 [Solirubrobacteraceae bacterium]|nr:hypothetical protein [Solirubrobacteraceae bacterium]